MINARQADMLSQENRYLLIKKEFKELQEKIETYIRRSIKDGYHDCRVYYYYHENEKDIEDWLRRHGYSCVFYNGLPPYYIEITW